MLKCDTNFYSIESFADLLFPFPSLSLLLISVSRSLLQLIIRAVCVSENNGYSRCTWNMCSSVCGVSVPVSFLPALIAPRVPIVFSRPTRLNRACVGMWVGRQARSNVHVLLLNIFSAKRKTRCSSKTRRWEKRKTSFWSHLCVCLSFSHSSFSWWLGVGLSISFVKIRMSRAKWNFCSVERILKTKPALPGVAFSRP